MGGVEVNDESADHGEDADVGAGGEELKDEWDREVLWGG